MRFFLVFLLLYATIAPAAGASTLVSIVRGETALVSPNDKAYATNRARGIGRDLDEAGVASTTYSDKELPAALAAPCRVAHLICLEAPSADQLAQIDAFLKRGGKLVVHYSPSAALAKRMGLGAPKPENPPATPWTGFAFGDARPLHAPLRVDTATRRVLTPASQTKGVRVLAWWTTPSGQKGPAAVYEAPQGYWMSAMLGGDGNAELRRRFLAAITAKLHPEVWRHAAKRLDREVWGIVGATTFEEAAAGLRRTVIPARRERLEDNLATLQHLETQKRRDFKRGLFGAGIGKLWDMREPIACAYAAAHPLQWGSGIVAAWDPSGVGIHPGDWTGTAAMLERSGITDLYVMAKAPAFTTGKGASPASGPAFEATVRELAAAAQAGKRLGVRIHAWIPAMNLQFMTDAQTSAFVKEGRALLNASGKSVVWAAPGHARNREQLATYAAALVARTGVDGVHLDYIRFPHEQSSMGAPDRAIFEKWLGAKVKRWPADVDFNGPFRSQYYAWRATQVEDAVDAVSKAVRRARPGTVLSAAVYGKHPSCRNAVGQDWPRWVKLGLVDHVAPMNYTADLGAFEKLLRDQIEKAPRQRIVAGIGVTSFEANLNPVQVLRQMETASKLGVKGVAFYSLNPPLLKPLRLAR
ncbi:MAG: family 10 glycosylhydrolase [Kiritimatiellia bacterium]|jgi:hypothetical protein